MENLYYQKLHILPGMNQMKHLLLTGFLIWGTALQAQFTLTLADHYPSIGDEVYYTSFIDMDEPLPITGGGADLVWDFSEYVDGIQLLYEYIPVSQGLFPNDYPNSNWVERGQGYSNGSFSTGENYYSLGAQGVALEGQFIEGFGKVDYSIPRLTYPFPMNFGDVAADNWLATGFNDASGEEDTRTGQSTFEFDGYGTLILPHITLEDVVRVRTVNEQVIDLGPAAITFVDTIIVWYSQDFNHYVASYTKGEYIGFPGNDIITLQFIRNPEEIILVPELDISVSTPTACDGDCLTYTNLSDDGVIANAEEVSWLWTFPGGAPATSTAQNPGNVCYQEPGTYDVILEVTLDGLTFTETFPEMVAVVEGCGPIANFDYTPIVCLGQCYDFTNTSSNAVEYFWTFEGAATSISQEFSPTDICYLDQTGIYNVTLTVANANGSSTSITQQITVVNPPNVNAGPDQTIIQGTTTTLSAIAGNGTGNFIWQPFEDVTCFSCPATTTYPLNETTTFVVFYEQSGGCQSSDTVTVFVEESFGFGIPNSFSPNGDGVNDVLFVRGSNITRMNFVVYNRYGEEMFSTTDQSKGWDGTKNGRELNAGVFGYYLEVFQLDGTRHEVKGDVTMVR